MDGDGTGWPMMQKFASRWVAPGRRRQERRTRDSLILIAAVVAGTFATVLSVATIGVPATLILAGAWAFAALLNSTFPAISGPVSWAAGAVLEVVFIMAESFVLALLWPHPHVQYVYVATLLLPLIVSGAAWLFLPKVLRPSRASSRERVGAQPWLALLIVVLVEGMFEAINLHGQYFGLTWIMSGDARNHVASDRTIDYVGGLTLKGLKAYPEIANAVAAMVAGAGGRANLSGGVLMIRDVQAMVATTVLFTVGSALLFVSVLSETLHRVVGEVRRVPLLIVGVLGACASLGISSYVLGLVTRGGFFPTIGAICFVLATLALGMRVVSKYHDVTLVLLTLSMFLVVGTWTLLVVVPIACLIVAYASLAWRARSRLRGDGPPISKSTWCAVAFSLVCLLGIVAELVANRATLEIVIQAPGDITPLSSSYLIWLGVAAVVAVIIAPTPRQRLVRLVPVATVIACGVALWWIHSLMPTAPSWPYYATKMLWLSTVAVVWVPFVLVTDVMTYLTRWRRLGVVRHVGAVAVAVVGSWSLLWFANYEAGWPFIMEWAYVGSTFPSPKVVNLVVHEANEGGRFVIYDYFNPLDDAINDRLGDYWAGYTWDFQPDGLPYGGWGPTSFVYWASIEDNSVGSLCQELTRTPMRVVTRSTTLKSQLLATCPAYRVQQGHQGVTTKS